MLILIITLQSNMSLPVNLHLSKVLYVDPIQKDEYSKIEKIAQEWIKISNQVIDKLDLDHHLSVRIPFRQLLRRCI